MVLKNYYYYFIKALPLPLCKKILKACRQKITSPGTTGDKSPDDKKSHLYFSKDAPPVRYRDCKVAWIEEQWIYDILNPFIQTANKEADWNFQWDWNETSQFTIYKKGHYYGWHADQTANLYPKDRGTNIEGKIRKLSLTLQLTDKKNYTGGDFQFKWMHPAKGTEIQTVKDSKEIGTIIVFPSFVYHQVTPITKGKRESLVNWSLGKSFN